MSFKFVIDKIQQVSIVIIVALVSILGLSFVAWFFYDNVLFKTFPPESVDYYSGFGSYFGGIAGTLISLAGVLLVVHNLRQQSCQIKKLSEESIKRDLLLYLSAVDSEIERLLDFKMTVAYDKNKSTEFRKLVYGLCSWNVDALDEFRPAILRLLMLEINYCQAISLYKENVNTYFIFDYYRKKAELLHDFLETHRSRFDVKELISLDFCRHHLYEKN